MAFQAEKSPVERHAGSIQAASMVGEESGRQEPDWKRASKLGLEGRKAKSMQ